MLKRIIIPAVIILSRFVLNGQDLNLLDYRFEDPTRGIDVIELQQGGFLLTGNSFSSNTRSASIILIKTESQGDLVWKKKFEMENKSTFGWSLQEFNQNYYVLGFTESEESTKVLLMKTDAEGNLIWQKEYGVSDSQIGWNLTQGASQLVATGERISETGKKASWIFGINEDGEILWELKPDAKGKVERTFYASKFKDGSLAVTGISAIQEKVDDDVLLMKVNNVGKLEWRQLVEVGDLRDVGHAVKVVGKIMYAYGYYQLDSTFNPVITRISHKGKNAKTIKVDVPDHDVRIMNGEKTSYGHLLVGYAKHYGEDFFSACVIQITDKGEVKSLKKYGEQGLNNFYGIRKVKMGFAIIGSVTKDGRPQLTLALSE